MQRETHVGWHLQRRNSNARIKVSGKCQQWQWLSIEHGKFKTWRSRFGSTTNDNYDFWQQQFVAVSANLFIAASYWIVVGGWQQQFEWACDISSVSSATATTWDASNGRTLQSVDTVRHFRCTRCRYNCHWTRRWRTTCWWCSVAATASITSSDTNNKHRNTVTISRRHFAATRRTDDAVRIKETSSNTGNIRMITRIRFLLIKEFRISLSQAQNESKKERQKNTIICVPKEISSFLLSVVRSSSVYLYL